MQPLIAPQRCYIPGGLWTPKLGGKVTEGDSKRTSHVVEGKVILIQSVTNYYCYKCYSYCTNTDTNTNNTTNTTTIGRNQRIF